ncbi:MAG TPA: hypothetical protein VD997_09310 [Phycisphaerales bacterium]|nr:hypothetical protein [Phycisphaerales bacterium]
MAPRASTCKRSKADAPAPVLDQTFEARTLQVLAQLRGAVQSLIAALPVEAPRAVDLRRALNIDAALAWQIFSLANHQDLLRTGRLVPKAGAMRRFVESAQSAGTSAAAIADLQTAYQQFEVAVKDVAGDRRTFDAILSGLCPDDESALLRLRRAAFRANASVWGVSARASIHSVIFYERPTGEHDCLGIRGRVGLRKLQEGASIGIYASSRTWGGSTCPPDSGADVAVDGCTLLPEYSTKPLPKITRLEGPDGLSRDYVQLEKLGRSGEVTVFWRNLTRNFPGGSRTPPHGITAPCLEPSEVLLLDLIIPHGWVNPSTTSVWVTPESSRYATAHHGLVPHRLPFEGSAEYLGTSLQSLRTTHMPRYHEMVTQQLDLLKWHIPFDIFRCVVNYPVLHSAVNLCVGAI